MTPLFLDPAQSTALYNALEDLVRVIRRGDLGDYSAIMDEIFDGEAALRDVNLSAVKLDEDAERFADTIEETYRPYVINEAYLLARPDRVTIDHLKQAVTQYRGSIFKPQPTNQP